MTIDPAFEKPLQPMAAVPEVKALTLSEATVPLWKCPLCAGVVSHLVPAAQAVRFALKKGANCPHCREGIMVSIDHPVVPRT